MRLHTLGASVALILASSASPALAQSDYLKTNIKKIVKKVGFHASASFSDPIGQKNVVSDGSYGVSVGLAPGHTGGWKYPVGLAWFTEEFKSPNGTNFAELKARPVVGGIGYGWHVGKWSTTVQLQAGWSFNSLKPNDDLQTAFDSSGVAVDVDNAFVVRPQARVEYFLTPKFTLRSSLNYVMSNPRVTIVRPEGTTSQRWNASNVTLSVGLGIYPFRK